MIDKAYIVTNKRQELDVLKKFEEKGLVWATGEKPTNLVLSAKFDFNGMKFPYALIEGEDISWLFMTQLTDETIAFDGRNEYKMIKKYKVTQKFVDELIKWRDHEDLNATNGKSYNYINDNDLDELPVLVEAWWVDEKNPIERNDRLIAIIQWLNGEDVFELEQPHKFVVRNDTPDEDGDYYYVQNYNGMTERVFSSYGATKFDTREEAQEWANSHQVVVEIDAEGNEVK